MPSTPLSDIIKRAKLSPPRIFFAAAIAISVTLGACAGAPPPEEDWELDTSSATEADRSMELVPADLRALVDQVASDNTSDATKAWLEIGARYRNSGAFLAALKPALYDSRPAFFRMTREKFSGGGNSFVYFTVKTGKSKGVPAYVHTVGQSLCYHLWQYEDVSNSGFKGTFKAWWAGYAPSHRLPGPRKPA
jgi:hypothetical protein